MSDLHSFPGLVTALEPSHFKRWTVQDYHRMSKLGLLHANERTELIYGQILLMAAKGTAHVLALRLLARVLADLLANQTVFISTQDPIQLDDFSEPEPDLALVRGTALDYLDHHPQPRDIYLVVEVADSTLNQDCTIKDKLYAQAEITEYWVVDLPNRQLHIFQNPTPKGYTSHLMLTEPHSTPLQAFPNLSLDLTSILPPDLR